MDKLNSNAPTGPLENRWEKHKFDLSLIAPQNRKKYNIIVIGTGLAGASLCATLGEAGYNVQSFCYNDSPRRAHSIAAQGGVNASKNYQNDGDSTWRLFYDTIKGGDFRARESNIYRLAQLSCNIIDQAVSQGVPFAREYSGYLANRSFGGTQVSRTFYARGQTGQQLLLGAYSSMSKEIASGRVKHKSRCEMLEVIIIDGKARGIVVRDLITGEISSHLADCVVMCTGGYSNAYYLSTNAKGCNTSATWRAHKNGAYFANPSFTQIHPTCVPPTGDSQSKLTLMSESLRNDGRIWAPKNIEDCDKNPNDIPDKDRDYFLERMYPAFANLVPRDIASRALKGICDEGRGVGSVVNNQRLGVYLDFSLVIQKMGAEKVKEKYGNLFDMYESITGENPYEVPMKIYPAPHYTMGGLWVDYNLMTTIDGLFACGEANFSDHGANRLGASALMQGLADGYFVLPYTIGDYLADDIRTGKITTDSPEFDAAEKEVSERITFFINNKGTHSVDYYHKKLGKIMWDKCGMSRNADGLKTAIEEISTLRKDFWENVNVPGTASEYNEQLAKAGRVADFLELGELFAKDALVREESAGGHFREEHQTEEGEAKRVKEFQFVSAWEYKGAPKDAILHKEELVYENIEVKERSYK